MKKTSTMMAALALGTAVFVDAASAQEVSTQLLVGATRSGFTSEYLQDAASDRGLPERWVVTSQGSRLLPSLGVGVSATILGPLALRAEVVAVAKGFTDSESYFQATYLELPLLVEVVVPWKGAVSLRGVAGIAPGREVTCRAQTLAPVSDMLGGFAPPRTSDCSEFRTERSDMGTVFGVGFAAFSVAGVRVAPEFRLVSGKTDLISNDDRHRAKNNTWTLLLSIAR